MGRRVPRHRNRGARNGSTGRVSKLTERTEDAIIHAVLSGNHLTTACDAAGVSRQTLYNWLNQAERVEQAMEAGEPVDESALPFLDFRYRLADARAQAEMRAVQVVHRQMQGGNLVSEKPLLDVEGQPVRGDDGEILYERVWSQPDGRLALSYLGRSRPESWGQNAAQRVELTGANGGPVQHQATDEDDQIPALAARLAAINAARLVEDAEDGVLDDDTETVLGEIVEDERGE